MLTNFEQVIQMLMPLLIQFNLGLSRPLLQMVATLTACLLEGTTAHLTALAEALPDVDTDHMAKEQRTRRVLSHSRLSPTLFLPVFVQLLRPVLATLPEVVLSMDRTHWKKRKRHINILMVSVHFQARAIPVFWRVLDRAGNSAFEHWKTVLTPVMTEFQAHAWLAKPPLIMTADRECASPQLAEWLKTTYHVESVLRLKRREYLCDQAQEITLADVLRFFPQGDTRYYPHVTVTKTSQFLVNVTITWSPDAEEPLLLIATFEGAGLGIMRYHCRFGIEAMFKDQKSNGFDVEQTRVTDSKRIETLLIFTTLAHIFCTTEGYRQEIQGDTKKNDGAAN
ncbi:putative transposase [Candidatus Moduliflexus flocculans]|uniref:Putative transposase n=1 Tax=Candidatus Moduliflexus flocculans TaxID=1499966 RepID=A0A0S6VV95_9BACT|nr:putative transposase [Candidatus Moduliflexus flocculans]